jgi:ribosomal protein L11 methylase PrmA
LIDFTSSSLPRESSGINSPCSPPGNGGKLALSGILDAQTDALIARYSEWFNMDTPTKKDAWVLLTGSKR